MSTQIVDLARHTGIYGIGTIVGGIARVALIPIIARFLPTAEYGKASVVLIFISLLAIISELGFSSSLIRFANEASSEEERRMVVSTIVLTSLLLLLPIVVICSLLTGELSGLLLGSVEYGSLIVIGIVGGLGNAILQIGLSFERALARSLRYVIFTSLKGGFSLALSIILVVALRKGATGLLVGAALPPVVIGIAIYGRLLKLCGVHFSRQIFKAVIGFGSPLVPMNLALWVLAYSDIYLLRRLIVSAKALSEVGLYQYGHEICLVLVLPISSLNLAWPQFLFSNYSKPGAPEKFSKVHLYLSFFLIEIAFLLSIFSHEIIRIVGSAKYMGSSEVIPYLAGSLVFYGFSIIFSSGLYVTGKTKTLAAVVMICAAVNVLLNFILIPPLGKQGAAIATLATNVVMAGGILVFAHRSFPIPFRLGASLLGVLTAAAVVGGFALVLSRGLVGLGLLTRFAATCLFTLILLLILGIRHGDLRGAIATFASVTKPSEKA